MTELQVISHDDPVLELANLTFCAHCSPTTFILKPRPSTCHPPPPPGTRKAAKPLLVCGFVATKRPNRVGERAGNAQGAEPRLTPKRGASWA
jgi:hypothetical protein